MIYLVCFIISMLIFLWAIANSHSLKMEQYMLIIVTVIGNGGYYALDTATCLETAILANILTYMIGIFSPMLLFLNVCELCRFRLNRNLIPVLYSIQSALFLSVCTMGKLDIFYKSVDLITDESGSYLVKTYGPFHTVYLVFMFLYLAACLIVSVYSVTKRNLVSMMSVEMMIFAILTIVGTYLFQRQLHLKVELVPVVFTAGIVLILIPIVRKNRFSIDVNREIIYEKLEKSGYIVFSRKLCFMGCNNTAAEFFPELEQWELEKKVPGSGGRFNTFLRQPLMKYIASDEKGIMKGSSFTVKDKRLGFYIRRLTCGRRHIGYLIELIDLTDLPDTPLMTETIFEHDREREECRS